MKLISPKNIPKTIVLEILVVARTSGSEPIYRQLKTTTII